MRDTSDAGLFFARILASTAVTMRNSQSVFLKLRCQASAEKQEEKGNVAKCIQLG